MGDGAGNASVRSGVEVEASGAGRAGELGVGDLVGGIIFGAVGDGGELQADVLSLAEIVGNGGEERDTIDQLRVGGGAGVALECARIHTLVGTCDEAQAGGGDWNGVAVISIGNSAQ